MQFHIDIILQEEMWAGVGGGGVGGKFARSPFYTFFCSELAELFMMKHFLCFDLNFVCFGFLHM